MVAVAEEEARYIAGTAEARQYIQVNNVEPALTAATGSATPTVITTDSVLLPLQDSENDDNRNEENFWDRNKTKHFLTLCLDKRFKCVNNEKMIWDEIAILLGTTPDECEKKYKSLKRTYIRLFRKKRIGRNIKWIHYNACEEVFKDCKSMISAILEPWEDTKTRKLLSLYIENISKFQNNNMIHQKDIWRDIALQLNTSDYNCYHKFKNLKRTYFKWIERHRETGKLVKWPYYQYFERIFYNYTPHLKSWDRHKTRLLISSYTAIAHKFRNPKYQKKQLWKEISQIVGENAKECDRKFRNLKQTYNRLKKRLGAEKSLSKWRYYKDFVVLFESKFRSTVEETQERQLPEDYVDKLLDFCVKNKAKFSPLSRKKILWKEIGPKIGLTAAECDKKFRNLKQTYIRLLERKQETGTDIAWPYFSYFEQIYRDEQLYRKHSTTTNNAEKLSVSEVRQIITNIQTKETDKFEQLVRAIEDSNKIQRERNKILLALLNKHI